MGQLPYLSLIHPLEAHADNLFFLWQNCLGWWVVAGLNNPRPCYSKARAPLGLFLGC